uniref:Fibroblast growth factor binding protein 3 n=1 Tax=Neogobius melanostomus TaxID=47308 RepID=A0A8C6SKS1_9GOBI
MKPIPVSFLVLLLLCLPVLPEAKRQPGQPKPDKPRQPPPSTAPPTKRARNRSVPSSGELSTKDGHSCIWQTSGEGLVSLSVNCTVETLGVQYWCRYAGKPDLCEAYGVKSSQYWKQMVGKLKKRQNACEGEKVLKAKTCKKAPAEAHLKLALSSAEEERKTAKKREGRKEGVDKGAEELDGPEERTGLHEEGVLNDMAPVQSYCGEGWHSVCSFFVRFFEG